MFFYRKYDLHGEDYYTIGRVISRKRNEEGILYEVEVLAAKVPWSDHVFEGTGVTMWIDEYAMRNGHPDSLLEIMLEKTYGPGAPLGPED